ncbi:MAG: 50S ribosomal protein L24e [Candidatus Woesearchaeota archaeon]
MKCSFCGTTIERGTGKIFVRTSGKLLYFCSRKCEKNTLKLGRKPRLVKWTQEFRKEKAGAK